MVSSLIPNAYISKLILIPASDMNASSDDPRTELDSHTNMVILGSNSFVFESTGRTFNVKPFSSDVGVVKNDPIVNDLACD